jgi:hypothetical protein
MSVEVPDTDERATPITQGRFITHYRDERTGKMLKLDPNTDVCFQIWFGRYFEYYRLSEIKDFILPGTIRL